MQNKRYYWLKLHEHFFDRAVIKYLRKLPDGDTIVLIYLELLVSGSTALAAKNASDYITKMADNFNRLINGDFLTSYKMMILHPISFSRL